MNGRLVLLVIVGLTAPLVAAVPAHAATNCPPAAGKVTVALVIDDDRSLPGVECWTVPEGTTGAQLLAMRADRLGRPAPRYDRSGLLCAIDGYPTTGCGEPTGDGAYVYWSYWWRVPSGWKYATTGPATKVLRNGDVEGWHFIVGRGTGGDLAPRLNPGTITFENSATAPPSPTTTRDVLPTNPPTAPPASRPSPGVSTPSSPQPSPGAPVAPAQPSSSSGGPGLPEPTVTVPAEVAGVTTTVIAPLADAVPPATTPPTTTTAPERRENRASPVLVDDETGGSGYGGVLGGLGVMAVAIPAAIVWIRRRRLIPDGGHPDAGP
jgi:hypothetical protein